MRSFAQIANRSSGDIYHSSDVPRGRGLTLVRSSHKGTHEKRVTAQLELKRVYTFLPLLHQIHRWSDRRSMVEIPVFSCYAFVRMVQTVEERLKVPQTPLCACFVGSERQESPIPDEQIESLRKAISK